MRYALGNCAVCTGDEVLRDKAVVVSGRHIESVIDAAGVPSGLEVFDLGGGIIAPGLIDMQVNGGGGLSFNDSPTADALAAISSAHRRSGTTGFLPTLTSTSLEVMLLAVDAVEAAMRDAKLGVLGLHLEGPYISRAGIHERRHMRPPSRPELQALLERGSGVVKVVTLAPELVDPATVGMMKERGIVVSAGHSEATCEQAEEFFRWGGSSVTHLFNAMTQLGSREPGLVGAALADEEVWASVIADGVHVHFTSLALAARLKREKLFLVSDALPCVGTDLTSFRLGGRTVRQAGGRWAAEDGKLAGSGLTMAAAVRNCVEGAGIPLAETLAMASTRPAEILGLHGTLGRIRPGCLANLVVLGRGLEAEGVVMLGEYERL